MERKCLPFLQSWLNSSRRLPLIIRGARQVGKTWVVRRLAELENRDLIELNFELSPDLASLFEQNDPAKVVQKIDAVLNRKVIPGKSILFLDEIQSKPQLIAKLRWFTELMPELPVIAAGSLLEFALGNFEMSMPVGRIEYLYLEPLSFEEFLLANQRDGLVRLIQGFTWGDDIPSIAHKELISLFNEYVIIGGMPAAVKTWVETKSIQDVQRVQRNILTTYREDFPKYGTRISSELIDKVLMAIPVCIGKKFVYSRIDRTATSATLHKALALLRKARVCYFVECTSANGMPLGAEVNEKFLRVIFIDVGLCSIALKLSLNELEFAEDLNLVNKGQLAEQVTGQLLRTLFDPGEDPSLYYWLRPDKGATAELDYVIAQSTIPVPIEVKAGSSGSLKSLHVFMELKGFSKAVRICSGLPNITEVSIKKPDGNRITYELRSIPFYFISEIHRLLQ